jgi:acetyltransferase-like isoleucine patch superfamily enzyme
MALLPATALFDLKRFILRHLGIDVGEGSCVCGGVKFYGAGKIIIGKDVWIGMGCRFYTSPLGDVVIGDRCDIAPDVVFHSGSHEIGGRNRRAGRGTGETIRVGAGSWIGVRATLTLGSEIGESSIVGAGSLVVGQAFPASSLVLGVPARFVRELDPDAV